jgi:hypothetical protein
MVYLEENRDTGRNVEPLRCDRRESHLPAIREQRPYWGSVAQMRALGHLPAANVNTPQGLRSAARSDRCPVTTASGNRGTLLPSRRPARAKARVW